MSKTGSFFMCKGRVGKGVYHNTSKNGTPVINFNLGQVTGKTPNGELKWESCTLTAWKNFDIRTGAYVCVTGVIRSQKVGDKFYPLLVVETVAVIDDSKAEVNAETNDPERFYNTDDSFPAESPSNDGIPF